MLTLSGSSFNLNSGLLGWISPAPLTGEESETQREPVILPRFPQLLGRETWT